MLSNNTRSAFLKEADPVMQLQQAAMFCTCECSTQSAHTFQVSWQAEHECLDFGASALFPKLSPVRYQYSYIVAQGASLGACFWYSHDRSSLAILTCTQPEQAVEFNKSRTI